MNYRAEIDGLRALAVLPVILFHVGFERMSGGFLGVDIFFVISGYLITSILISSLDSRDFNLVIFYERRARRIFPALFFTLFLSSILAPFFLIPDQIKDLGQSIVSVSTFLSNYFFYLELDYFNDFSVKNPLLHTWSLSVEEQFYFLFPPLLYLAHKKGISFTVFFLLLILLLSFGLAIFLNLNDPSLSFYSLHTRAWELMIGALIGILLYYKKANIDAYFRQRQIFLNTITIVALGAIILSMFFLNKSDSHPGFATLLPVSGTALLIIFCGSDDIVTKLLKVRLLVLIGLISYSLYLLHNPIFAFLEIHFEHLDDENRRNFKLIALPLIFLMSTLCYKYVETPFRDRSIFPQRFIFISSFLMLSIFVSFGYLAHIKNGFKTEINDFYQAKGIQPLVDASHERDKIQEVRDIYRENSNGYVCKLGVSCRNILVLGDSFAEDIFLAISYSKQDVSIERITFDDTCMNSLLTISSGKISSCTGLEMKDFIGKVKNATDIIISAKWQKHTYKGGLNFVDSLHSKTNARLYVVGSILFSNIQAMHLKLGPGVSATSIEAKKLFYQYIRWDRLRVSNELKGLSKASPHINWIEKSEFFCTHSIEQCELISDENLPSIWDNAHLTVDAYQEFAQFILERLLEDSLIQ